jgi:hypothetical protein
LHSLNISSRSTLLLSFLSLSFFLFFIAFQSGLEQPRAKPIKRLQQQQTLTEFLTPYYTNGSTDILYYEQLDVPLEELENKTCVKISWLNYRGENTMYSILVPKEATLTDVANELIQIRTQEAKTGGAAPLATGRIRILRVVNNRINNVFPLSQKISTLDLDLVKLRADEEAPEELNQGPEDKTVQVLHFVNDTHTLYNFDQPFFLAIKSVSLLSSFPMFPFFSNISLPSLLSTKPLLK